MHSGSGTAPRVAGHHARGTLSTTEIRARISAMFDDADAMFDDRDDATVTETGRRDLEVG
ncbi:hypothetical protein DW322_08490 [Rhodococcus rhodnii]|uniref:Uncharacterized protein n=2 Tax=Rhodococcus rhodnii TaxID=38312 RepID=R7WIH2_9NOCA|nr:hypothetical protein [Rhodococcus rhodnii]EOM74983.1 hypothetical protein Rrhod_3703 [Rhodococcus rhodnii LMG 5362]TXG90253.1 hypothetical protein DW322_08490 [Rhodococcus rhodnii]